MQMQVLSARTIKIILFAACLHFSPFKAISQSPISDSCQSTGQLDMRDVFHRLKKKPYFEKKDENKNFQFALLPAGGYSSNTGLAIALGANAVFTLKGASKESSALSSFTYTQYKQSILPFLVSIWTKKDQFNIVLDDRYINYPSFIYGLSGKSNLNTDYTVNFSWLKLHQSVLTKLGKNMYGGIGLYYDYFWNIKEEKFPQTGAGSGTGIEPSSAFEYYTNQKVPADEETAFGPAFKFLYDSRDNPVNAKSGFYGSAMFHPSFKSWGSDDYWSSLVVDARKYVSLSENKYRVLAFWGYYWAIFGSAPFLLFPSTGWDELWNTGRGYSQGRYRGANMLYFESEYRFQITRNGLLGGVVFSNIQHFPNEMYTSYSNSNAEQSESVTAVGCGAGLRIKFNKCSRTNLAIDMGFGQNLPKPWFAINLGEVF
ncbi:MAG: hypothetical protein JST58_08870 [Bacteroidetes bacterium]|nr:hypothetical protein [Bacteroidota bacterium]